jgi:hypothetical protein
VRAGNADSPAAALYCNSAELRQLLVHAQNHGIPVLPLTVASPAPQVHPALQRTSSPGPTRQASASCRGSPIHSHTVQAGRLTQHTSAQLRPHWPDARRHALARTGRDGTGRDGTPLRVARGPRCPTTRAVVRQLPVRNLPRRPLCPPGATVAVHGVLRAVALPCFACAQRPARLTVSFPAALRYRLSNPPSTEFMRCAPMRCNKRQGGVTVQHSLAALPAMADSTPPLNPRTGNLPLPLSRCYKFRNSAAGSG